MANACRMKLVHEGWLAQEEQAALFSYDFAYQTSPTLPLRELATAKLESEFLFVNPRFCRWDDCKICLTSLRNIQIGGDV